MLPDQSTRRPRWKVSTQVGGVGARPRRRVTWTMGSEAVGSAIAAAGGLFDGRGRIGNGVVTQPMSTACGCADADDYHPGRAAQLLGQGSRGDRSRRIALDEVGDTPGAISSRWSSRAKWPGSGRGAVPLRARQLR